MTLKKSVVIILSLMMIVAMLAGCSTTTETPATSPDATAAGDAAPADDGAE